MGKQSDRGRGSDFSRGEDMKRGERSDQVPAASPFTELNERSREIFRLIVDGYVQTGEPIGSRTLSRMLAQNLSQATFATALYGMIDVDSLTVTFARAGHPGPIHLPYIGEPVAHEPEGGLLGIFPEEVYQAPRSWTERAYNNLIHFNALAKGGHFAAWEQPKLLSEEVRAGFRSLRGDKATALNR